MSVISARLVRLLLVLDAARRSATCAVIASNAGGLEGIVAPELALVRLSRLINSSNTCASVQGVFDVQRMWCNIRRHDPLFPISIRRPRDLRDSGSSGQDRCVCKCVCGCACAFCACFSFLAVELPIFFFTFVSLG